jgi:polyisoprenoid-binding protein YceI
MKKLIFFFVLPAFVFGAQSSFAEVPAWELDKPHSNFYFSVDHIYSTIKGRFENYSGTVAFDPANLAESKFVFEIEVDSIATHESKRDKHLLSPDFFNESDFPLIRFESTHISQSGPDSYDVAGKFTIKGKEYDLILPLTLVGIKDHPMMKGTRVAGFNGKVTIDRLAHGVGTGKFLEAGVVGRDVDIFVSLELLHKM